MSKEISFRLNLPLKSKARPRFGKGRTFMPASYREWQTKARRLLRMVWDSSDLGVLEHCEIHVVAHGPGRSDPDNLIGALLDALQPDKHTGWEGVIKDDRVTVVPVITFRWVKSKEQFWDVRILTGVS